ncbi:MAG: tetratricopeptide repeat protein [Candidatus Cloacimonetes bacterium]|nr:tetratricopeptide repeat protein [Candidatus Cloacimonadota bacterium]
MKITQSELIEFADEQNLIVFGKSKHITSKLKSLQRLIQRGLIPKPKWEGGNFDSFWENDSEIKEQVLWIDEKIKEGISYRQMKEELESEKTSPPEGLIAEDLILTINDLLEINPGSSEVLFFKVKILYLLGKREEALKILQSLETKCKDNKEFLFFVYDEMAHIYHNFDAKEEELKTCQKLISLAEEMGDNEKLGAAYCDMGNCIRDREMEMAFEYFQRSVDLSEGSDSLGDAYGSMYWIQQQKGNFSEAEKYLKKSLEIFIQSNNKQKECVSKANLGVLYLKSNRLSEALKLMQEAYHTACQLHDLDGEAAITGNIGNIYLKRGLFPKAIEHFRHAYHIASQIKHPRAQKVWLIMMSKVYKEMGNIKKSEFYLKESKKIEDLSNVNKEDKKQTISIKSKENEIFKISAFDIE